MKDSSIFAAGCSKETRELVAAAVADLAAHFGQQAINDPDRVMFRLFMERLQQTDGDPVTQLLSLANIAQRFDDAGRLGEFRREMLRTLAAMGRRAQVELLTSGER